MGWVRLGQDELILVEVGWYKWLIWGSSSLLHGLSASNRLSQASAEGGGGRGPQKISKSKQSLVRPWLTLTQRPSDHILWSKVWHEASQDSKGGEINSIP